MNRYAVAMLAAFVLMALGGFLLNRYGQARFDAGFNEARNEYLIVAADNAADAILERERIENESSRMSDLDIDADLVRLGIMRQPSDR